MKAGQKIRLLIVTHTLGEGGLEEVVRMYAEQLDRTRFDVTVAFMVGGRISDALMRTDLAVVHIAASNRFRRLVELIRLARRLRIDILHNHLSWYGMIAGMMAGAYRIETIHNTYTWFTGIKRWAFVVNCLVAHKVIAVSNVVRDFSLTYFPFLSPEKTVVIHNGVTFPELLPPREATRAGLRIADAAFVVTFVGRLEPEKGVSYLLDAVGGIRKQYPDLVLLIVGSGSLREDLERQAGRYDDLDVRFLGFRNDVPALLAASDVFVLPSLYEGFPLTLLQAMGEGCPSIATRVGGVPEIVEDGVTGLLVQPRSAAELTARIVKLHDNHDLRKRMGRQASERVKSEFTSEAAMRRTETLYCELLGISPQVAER